MLKHTIKLLFASLTGIAIITAVGAQDTSARLKGNWRIVGLGPPGVKLRGTLRIMNNNRYEYKVDDYVEKGRIRLDAAHPQNIDFAITEGPDRNKTRRGLFKFEGNSLVLSLAKIGADRPTEFTHDPELNQILWTGTKGP